MGIVRSSAAIRRPKPSLLALKYLAKPTCTISGAHAPSHYHPFKQCSYLGYHHRMRRTLRRSCEACAKSKLSCDLRTPQCSRCIKRKITNCVYANEPLTLSPTEQSAIATLNHGPSTFKESAQSAVSPPTLLGGSLSQAFDPFDVYPRTRLPRARVQQLINHCKHFEYVCRAFVLDEYSNPSKKNLLPARSNTDNQRIPLPNEGMHHPINHQESLAPLILPKISQSN